MVDISSILNKYNNEKNKPEPKPEAKPEPKPEAKDADTIKTVSLEEAIATTAGSQLDKNKGADCVAAYSKLVDIAKIIYNPAMDFKSYSAKKCDQAIADAIDLLQTSNSNFVRVILSDYATSEEYLAYHAVNVCILSLILGISCRMERTRLLELGKGALLHDIGLIKYIGMIVKPEILGNAERRTLKEHTIVGAELAKSLDAQISPVSILIIQQEHERVDGSGYPMGIKDVGISESAQIVGLADTYEAMTHRRPYRDKFSPLETIKHILTQKNSFSNKITKMLIKNIGIFPVGTIVRLSNKEVGIVAQINPESPFCPVVNIMFDTTTRELAVPRQVNLSENKMITIDDCIKS